MNVKVEKDKWIEYANAVGDMNPVHRDDDFAIKAGFKGVIAPGMWLASHVHRGQRISCAGPMGFKAPVYDGQTLEVQTSSANGKSNYDFSSEGELACRVRGVGDEYSNPEHVVTDVLHKYQTFLTRDTLDAYLDSLSLLEGGNLPGMLLASLSAPALLDFGSGRPP